MTDHKLAEKSWELAKSLGMSRARAAKHIGVSSTAYGRWIRRKSPMHRSSVEKIARFIKRVENGETFEGKPKQKMQNTPIENIDEDVRLMYQLIYKLEDKYGSLGKVEDDDPYLILLRKEVGAR